MWTIGKKRRKKKGTGERKKLAYLPWTGILSLSHDSPPLPSYLDSPSLTLCLPSLFPALCLLPGVDPSVYLYHPAPVSPSNRITDHLTAPCIFCCIHPVTYSMSAAFIQIFCAFISTSGALWAWLLLLFFFQCSRLLVSDSEHSNHISVRQTGRRGSSVRTYHSRIQQVHKTHTNTQSIGEDRTWPSVWKALAESISIQINEARNEESAISPTESRQTGRVLIVNLHQEETLKATSKIFKWTLSLSFFFLKEKCQIKNRAASNKPSICRLCSVNIITFPYKKCH